jgi:hypothetical protein
MMWDTELIEQLRVHFASLEATFTLLVHASDHMGDGAKAALTAFEDRMRRAS